ncbi:hypothetical protein CYL18_01615 [Pradoshia eiseniae]|uniref:Uncharacterized protein n=1 Tax=Pradoshia eiseniae TaxID=2064768 RepID=A0A2S7N3S5_9BACI|nr:hypothetical protein CYL18_01615 [Pradoshia eiseniae]
MPAHTIGFEVVNLQTIKYGKRMVKRREKRGKAHAVPRLHTGKVGKRVAEGGRSQAIPRLFPGFIQESREQPGQRVVERQEIHGQPLQFPFKTTIYCI